MDWKNPKRNEQLQELAKQLAPCNEMLDWPPELIKAVLSIPDKLLFQTRQAATVMRKLNPTLAELEIALNMAKVEQIMDEPHPASPGVTGVTGPTGPTGPRGAQGISNVSRPEDNDPNNWKKIQKEHFRKNSGSHKRFA